MVSLVAEASLPVSLIAEVGCGDGALLAELSARGFGKSLRGYDISATAVELAAARGLAEVSVFDGHRLPVPDKAFDLGILSHVLEHVPDPLPLLTEVARASRSVIVEVPLERKATTEIGHIHALDRSAVHSLVRDAGLRVVADLLDPLPREVHTFFADDAVARARGLAKAAVRRGLFRASPALAERALTLHYACACVPA